MQECPECGSHDVEDSQGSPEEKSDGQGYAWTVTYGYCCNRCGCEWNDIQETTRTVEVEKHGNEYDEGI